MRKYFMLAQLLPETERLCHTLTQTHIQDGCIKAEAFCGTKTRGVRSGAVFYFLSWKKNFPQRVRHLITESVRD